MRWASRSTGRLSKLRTLGVSSSSVTSSRGTQKSASHIWWVRPRQSVYSTTIQIQSSPVFYFHFSTLSGIWSSAFSINLTQLWTFATGSEPSWSPWLGPDVSTLGTALYESLVNPIKDQNQSCGIPIQYFDTYSVKPVGFYWRCKPLKIVHKYLLWFLRRFSNFLKYLLGHHDV